MVSRTDIRFARNNKSLVKYIISTSALTHKIRCSECTALQDLDDKTIVEANKHAKEHNWREGVDVNNNNETRVFCPECVDKLKPKLNETRNPL